jgi:hypothetical protein
MNRLQLYTGQHPLKNDDFDFIQSTYSEGIKASILAFAKQGNGYLVLDGCEPILNVQLSTPSIDVYNVSEGYLVYNYEVIRCPSQQISVPNSAALQYRIDEQAMPSGTRQYANGNVYETHLSRLIVVEESDSNGIALPFKALGVSISDLLKAQLLSINLPVSLLSGWGFQINKPNYLELFRELSQKNLVGFLETSQASPHSPFSEQICVLPVEARPLRDFSTLLKFHGFSSQGGGSLKLGYVILEIKTNGIVTIFKLDDDQNKSSIDINVCYL